MKKPKVVYMIGVFLLKKGPDGSVDMAELHTIAWYSKLEDAEEYLVLAGTQAKAWPKGTFYDDPFECRWTHCVIEEVKEGMWQTPNKICSWWGSVKHKGQINTTARKLKHPPKGLKIGNCPALTFP